MTLDMLDPGPDWTFPNVPRTPEGYLDTDRVTITPYRQRDVGGRLHLIDPVPTVRLPDGSLARLTDVVPPPPAA